MRADGFASATAPWLRALTRHAWRAPPACRNAHAALLRSRVVALAPVLAMLTLAWVPLELAWLGTGWGGATDVLLLRVGLAAGLVLLARGAPRLRASTVVIVFLWLQAAGFGLLQWRVGAGGAGAGAFGIGYGLFPFVLATQLAVLPLPWLRALLGLLPPALLLACSLLAEPSVAARWSDAWLFVLIGSVAVWTSAAQLHLLVDLLGARADAAHDALTGLSNRRAAQPRLQAEHARARREGTPLAVLLLDLDHFKRVNDAYGHAAGDAVLVAVANVLREELRGIDLPARHGGEEFLALLPDTDATQALAVAERLRTRIAALRVPADAAVLRITASIGVAVLDGREAADALVERADAALYAAKAGGRNRCVLADAAVRESADAGA